MAGDVAIVVDLGGTAIKHGLVDESGAVLERAQVQTGDLAFDSVIARIASVVSARKADLADRGISIAGVGVGVPGGVSKDRRIVTQSPNFPAWRDVPFQDALASRTGLPVHLDNDANLAALGEHWKGAGREHDSLCLMTLGTGVGGGLILDGSVWVGEDGMAGEVGWITIDPDEPSGLAGGKGSLEPQASASAIAAMGREVAESGACPILARYLDADGAEFGAREVFLAAEEGSVHARGVLARAGRALGIAVANIVNVLNIHLFVLGGGASPAVKYLEPAILEEVKNRAFRVPAEGVIVREAALGNDAGMLGAARTVFDRRGAH